MGGLDLGFSEDEAREKPKPVRRPVARPKPQKKKQVRDSSSEESSSDSESSDSSSSKAESPPRAQPENADIRMESESPSSSSSEEETDSKKALKKKLAGLAARRRAEQSAAVAGEQPAGGKRKLRQPYQHANVGMKENVSPPSKKVNTASEVPKPKPVEEMPEPKPAREIPKPEVPKAKTTADIPNPTPRVEVPVSAPAADWNTDFGRVVRQAIDNRKICPFRTLGLAPTSSMAEVKKRWAKLCLLLHPDKAPAEWKAVPELVDANQAINEAKRAIEQRVQAVALVRPQRPASHAQPFTLDKGTFGKRRVEIRWQPSPITNPREKVERYLVFIIHGGDPRRRDQMLNAGSVKEGTDPFFVIVEDDQRFARFFTGTSVTVSILASNAAGNSDPLTVMVPLR
jgi:hypothetical protein